MSGPSVQPVLLCACLAAGLLFDPMGFLRMTLVCCAAALGFALLGGMPRGARAAAFLGPGYLLAKEFRQK